MATPSQFRQYLIAQDEEGNNIEVTRSSTQVGVLAFDVERQVFVHCHVILEPLKTRRIFEDRGRRILEQPHRSRVRLFEFGEDEGNAFYITENADGETLRSYLASQSLIPVWLAMSLAVQILEGMNALLDVGCPLPELPLEAMRVWQSGTHSVKALVANYPMMEESANAAVKSKQAKALFVEESKKLEIFFTESLQQGTLGGEPMLEAARFAELLSGMIAVFTPEAKSSYKDIITVFETGMPLPPAGPLPASLSPRPLVASFLKESQTVARSLMQSVRIQSQKIDLVNPYVLRGTLIKSGQPVSIQQLPPERMTGHSCHESLMGMLKLSKTGKFPNLLPVLFLEENATVECMGEPIVEGISLCEILENRRVLDPYEIHLLLTSLNAALTSLENSQQKTNRLRLEDVFLFTGSGIGITEMAELTRLNLAEWPNFSIVLRSHPCLYGMSGRGSNPAALLPSTPIKKKDVEPLWHGGWLASLSCMLLGLSDGITSHQRTGISELDAIISLLDEEMKRTLKGNPSPRALFLSRYAKELERHAPIAVAGAEEWAELSGAPITKKRGADAETMSPSPLLAPDVIMGEMEHSPIGFAEALIQHPVLDEPEFIGGLRPMRATPQTLSHHEIESSWISMHEKKSLWWQVIWFVLGSMILAMGLAHFSGRALWQKVTATTFSEIESRQVNTRRDVENIELPAARGEISQSPVAKLPAPPSLLAQIDLSGSVPMSDPSKKPTEFTAGVDPAKLPPPTAGAAVETAKVINPAESRLTTQLQTYRKNGVILPDSLRAETEKAALAGNQEAMLALGNLLLRGAEKVRDERSAFVWYEKAGKIGEDAAALPLAECYLQGWGTKPDFAQAVSLLTKASLNGEARAKDLLAVCYARGLGVTRDDTKALALFTEAYAAGIPSACGNLGAMYLRGQGTAPDAERAAKLFEEGAKKNHADSMLLYAQSLEYGTGTVLNVEEAKLWYQKAARSGNAEASSWCRKKSVAY
ncbi:hypothetical protein BH11VER1_BH11VER1_34330 [soil metagenome]